MNIYDYAKLTMPEKNFLLEEQGLMMEYYTEKENKIYIYFLNGFFVEVTVKDGVTIENMPFKRGYKLNKSSFLQREERNRALSLAA